MATVHITAKKESKAEEQRLLACKDNLAVIKKKTNWTNKEMLITPDREYFSMGATYGLCSTFSTRPGGVYSDGVTMSNRLKSIRDSKTVAHWWEGHKPLIHYAARSFCPWLIHNDSTCNTEKIQKYLEYGASWQALHFNFYAFPVGKCSSFKAYLRIWNPSSVHDVCPDPQGQYHFPYAFTYSYNNSGHLRYHFDKDLSPPSQHQATGYGDVDIPSISNEGKGGGSTCSAIDYDIYNSHLGVASSTSYYSYQHTKIYRKDDSTDAYYREVEITGNALTSLKNAMFSGGVWMHLGYVMGDIISESGVYLGQVPFSTFLIYCSRIELRLVISCSSFNN